VDELVSYNSHLEKFNALLKRNEEEFRRRLMIYDIEYRKQDKMMSVVPASPERRKFME
jgi:hypothetical protein